jgi:hypothetical protein
MSAVSGLITLSVKLGEILSSGLKAGRVDHSFDLGALQTLRIAAGTGAGQMDKVFSEQNTAIGTTTTVDRDFAGSLVDSEGATITIVKAKLLLIYNGGTVPVTVKGKTGDVFALFTGSTDKITIPAGACILYFDPTGITVGAGTTDSITLGNASASVAAAFSMIVAGTSA